jgi:hypothetical protein
MRLIKSFQIKYLYELNIILPRKEKGIALQPIIEMTTKPILGNIIVKTFLKTENQRI